MLNEKTNENEEQIETVNGLPYLIGVQDHDRLGLCKSAFYRLLNQDGVPVVVIGGRKFLHRDKFLIWCENQIGQEEV